ncbi:hypothetical protein M1349_03750 [Patescibacteria group bacterium]|nr:hypothetical protein [Patescibacteria group bacterium]
MDNKSNFLRDFFFSSYKRTISIVFLFVLAISLPVTLVMVKQQQDVRQRASEVCPNPDPCYVHLVDPTVITSYNTQPLFNETAGKNRIDFKPHVDYVVAGQLAHQFAIYGDYQAKRITWNYIWGFIKRKDIKSFDPNTEIDYAAQKIWGKTWAQVKSEEKCPIASWDTLYTDPKTCTNLSIHPHDCSDPPTYLCDGSHGGGTQGQSTPNGGIGNCSASNVPNPPNNDTRYKWIPVNNCQKTCDYNNWQTQCPKNTDQPGQVTPDNSVWCYGYADGPKCLQLRYIGDINLSGTPPAPPIAGDFTCSLSLNKTNPNNLYGGKILADVNASNKPSDINLVDCFVDGKADSHNPRTVPYCDLLGVSAGKHMVSARYYSSTNHSRGKTCAEINVTVKTGPGGATPTPSGTLPPISGDFNPNPCYIQLTQPTIAQSPLSPWSQHLGRLTWVEIAQSHAQGGYHWDKFWGKYQAARLGWNYAMTGVRVQGAQGKGTVQDLNWLTNRMFGQFGITTWQQLQDHETQIGCPFLPIKEACNSNTAGSIGRCPSNASSQNCHIQPVNIDPMKPASFTCTKPGIITPTETITPTPTEAPTGETTLNISVKLPGIGKNENLGENNNPKNPSRKISVIFLDDKEQQVSVVEVPAAYNTSSGLFTGSITTGDQLTTAKNIPDGAYTVKLRLDNSLTKKLPGFQTIKGNQTITLPTTELATGDLNNDNILNLADYNIFISCFGEKQCDKKDLADLNDDGVVDEIDLNILKVGLMGRSGD